MRAEKIQRQWMVMIMKYETNMVWRMKWEQRHRREKGNGSQRKGGRGCNDCYSGGLAARRIFIQAIEHYLFLWKRRIASISFLFYSMCVCFFVSELFVVSFRSLYEYAWFLFSPVLLTFINTWQWWSGWVLFLVGLCVCMCGIGWAFLTSSRRVAFRSTTITGHTQKKREAVRDKSPVNFL